MWSDYCHPGTHISFPIPIFSFFPGWEECLSASFLANAERQTKCLAVIIILGLGT